MRFWDSSAIMPLIVSEHRTAHLQKRLLADPAILVWWVAEIECVSAVARLEREGALTSTATSSALKRMDSLKESWHEVQPTDALRRTARRLLLVHRLRAADALQLAAVIVACEGHPESLEFVCLDDNMNDAAAREGFAVFGSQTI